MSVRFSIVIPARNAASSLGFTLRSLQRQTMRPTDFECLLIDDGSHDETYAVAKASGSGLQLKIYRHSHSLSRATARNVGWRHAMAEWIIFLDADMVAAARLLEAYDEAIQQGPSVVDVYSGERFNIEVANAAQVGIEGFRETARIGAYPTRVSQRFALELPEVCATQPDSLGCAYSLVGSNCAVRKSALEGVSGFDRFVRRSQDIELGIRLWLAGSRFACTTGAEACHLYAPSPDRRQAPEEQLAFFYRHPYNAVFLVSLWQLFQVGDSTPVKPFQRLVETLEAARRPVRSDWLQFGQIAWGIPLTCVTAQKLSERLRNTFNMPSSTADEAVERAVEQGVFRYEAGGNVYFDDAIASDWLASHTRLQLRHVAVGRPPSTHTSSECERVVEMMFERARPDDFAAYIPLPIENEYQARIRLIEIFPRDLLDYRHEDSEVEYPVRGSNVLVVRLRFSCSMASSGTSEGLGNLPADAWQPETDVVRHGLEQIETWVAQEASSGPRAYFEWILKNVTASRNPLPAISAAVTGLATPNQAAWLFAALCIRSGICARLRRSALPSPNASAVLVEPSQVLDQWWAEFSDDDRWTPVDFSFRDPWNLSDSSVGEHYFGRINAFRLHLASGASNRHAREVLQWRGASFRRDASSGFRLRSIHAQFCEATAGHWR